MFLHSVASGLLHPQQTCSFKHQLNVFKKNSAILELLHESYSFTQFQHCLSELGQHGVNKIAQTSNNKEEDPSPCPLNWAAVP